MTVVAVCERYIACDRKSMFGDVAVMTSKLFLDASSDIAAANRHSVICGLGVEWAARGQWSPDTHLWP